MNQLRTQVLKIFKKLHKTRIKVFEGDIKALTAARVKINEEFTKNKDVTDEANVQRLILLGEDVERLLRTHVIQAKEVRPGVFEAKITDSTIKLDNVEFDEHADLPVTGKTSRCKKQAKEDTS